MDDILPYLLPGSCLLVIVAPRQAIHNAMMQAIAHLALRGAVTVIDGGNCYDAYAVARSLRSASPDLEKTLKQSISLARPFTCYQAVALLARTFETGRPLVALDLLATFYDESITLAESRRLLQKSIPHLRRLSRRAPLVVSVAPPRLAQAERLALVELLQGAAEHLLVWEPPLVSARQLPLF